MSSPDSRPPGSREHERRYRDAARESSAASSSAPPVPTRARRTPRRAPDDLVLLSSSVASTRRPGTRLGRAPIATAERREVSRRLQMRLDHPQPFVDSAGYFGEDVRGTCIAQLGGLVDRLARYLTERRQRARQRVRVIAPGNRLGGILAERRSLCDNSRRSLGDATELHGALGNEIHVLLDVLVHLVEQLVQSDEGRTLHVPMSLLALGLQVDGVGEPRVQELDEL